MSPDSQLSFLVIENAPDVCEGIIERMKSYHRWNSLGFCTGVKTATAAIRLHRPSLLFMDWSLNGGSAYELLEEIQNMPGYLPYIIFCTGYQKDNPEIPQEIMNHYRVDKYILKPIWETIRLNLSAYLAEAESRIVASAAGIGKIVWLKDGGNRKHRMNLASLVCIVQHPTLSRCRNFYLAGSAGPVSIPITWQECQELLAARGVQHFTAKSRSYILVRDYILTFDKPYVRMKGLGLKFEVVKESLTAFEIWLGRQ